MGKDLEGCASGLNKVLPWNLHGGTEGKHEKIQSL
jgi:hypothetical protein